MRRYIFGLILLGLVALGHASSTLRVGNQVLTTGDSAVRVIELLGEPSYKSYRNGARNPNRSLHGQARPAAPRAELWQYRRDSHVTTVTIVGGRVFEIEDRRL